MAARRCSVIELDVKARDLCLFLSGFVTERQTVEENEWTLGRNSVRVDRELSPSVWLTDIILIRFVQISAFSVKSRPQDTQTPTFLPGLCCQGEHSLILWSTWGEWRGERGNKLKISSSLSCIMIEIICCYHYGFVNWTKWNIVVCCGNPSRYFEIFKLIFSQWKLLCRRIWW